MPRQAQPDTLRRRDDVTNTRKNEKKRNKGDKERERKPHRKPGRGATKRRREAETQPETDRLVETERQKDKEKKL